MKTEITLEQLAAMITAHLESGGVVLDSYRNEGSRYVASCTPFAESYGAGLRLRCPESETEWGTTIPASDTLHLIGHEVHYTPTTNFGYLGRIVFLNPAPCALPPEPASATAALSPAPEPLEGMSPAQVTAIRCAYADLQGSKQAHEQLDLFAHDWDAHELSIGDLEREFPFLTEEVVPLLGCEICGDTIPVGSDKDMCPACRLGMYNQSDSPTTH